jgi:hypothetical protein
MDNAANEEAKTSGKPKKSLGTRGAPQQTPSSGAPGTRQRRKEAVVLARKNPEED